MKKNLKYAFIAFLLTIIAFCLFLAFYGVLGYGNYTILRGDLVAQYIDFISMYIRVLKGEEDFWYSFSLFYGSGTILNYAYYAFSPFNLLFLIDAIPVATMMTVVITLKIGFCGFTFALFAQYVLKSKARYTVFFALCYAMNTFTVTLHFNLIWLDAAYMLPLVILLLYRLVTTGKWLLMTQAWAYLFITNFYMAYMVGIFSAFVFVALLIIRCESLSKSYFRDTLRSFLRFSCAVGIAAALSAAILVPTAMFLLSHMAADNFGFEPLPTTLLEVAGSLFMGEMPDIDNRIPFLYCGLPVLLLFPFYFMQKDISLKERITTGALLLIYILSIVVLPLFIFMHAFDYPNWYYFRFSFCICFMLCAIACRTSDHTLKQRKISHILLYAALLLCFYSFMIGFGPLNADGDDVTNSSSELAINMLFMVLWVVFFSLHHYLNKNSKRNRAILYTSAFLVLILELAVNGKLCLTHIGLTPESEVEFNSWYQAEADVLSAIPENDTDLYRVAMYGEGNCNAPAFWGYAGLNTFSSSDVYELRRAVSGLGIACGNRFMDELGYTDVTRMLFGVKYIGSILKASHDDPARERSMNIFPYYLPFAYMVSADINNYQATTDPFENQEQLVKCMTGNSYHFFDRLELSDITVSSFNAEMQQAGEYTVFRQNSHFVSDSGVYLTADQKKDQPFMVCFYQEHPSASLDAPYVVDSDDNFAISSTLSYGCLYKGDTFNGNFGENKETVAVYFHAAAQDEWPCRNIYLAYYNGADLPAAREDLAQGAMQLSDHLGGYLRGTVQATEDHPVLFTSIPYEKGWEATVDGVSAPIVPVLDDSFISLVLTPGAHDISLQYVAPGSRPGLYITLTGACVFLILCCLSLWTAKKRNK